MGGSYSYISSYESEAWQLGGGFGSYYSKLEMSTFIGIETDPFGLVLARPGKNRIYFCKSTFRLL